MKKNIRRGIIYILAFFIVMSRRLSQKSKRWVAYACCIMLLLCSVFPTFYEGNLGFEQTVALTERMSGISDQGKEVSVVMTNSRLVGGLNADGDTERNGNENRVVVNESSDSDVSAKNRVADEPEPLFLVEGIYADYGMEMEDVEPKQKYQYPVEKDQETSINFNQKQKCGDYIVRETHKVEPEDDMVSNNTIETETSDEGVEVVEIPDEPMVEVTVTVSDNSVSGNSISENSIEGNSVLSEEEEKVFDAGCYSFNGILNKAGTHYLSNVLLKPLGIDGYNLVRIGNKGKFYRSVLLTEEGTNLHVPLYFSNGKKISNEVSFLYSKDTARPCLNLMTEDLHVLEMGETKIYCINGDDIEIAVSDEEPGSGIAQVRYEFGDRTKYILDDFADAELVLDTNYFGSVRVCCEDKAGNTSSTEQLYCLYENNAPVVTIDETQKCSAPYSMGIHVTEEGEIVSGIREVRCKVNGEEVEMPNRIISETTTIYPELTVPTKGWYQLLFEEVGEYEVEFSVVDNAGNVTTEERTIKVTEPELVSVFMPEHFTIHIDPQQLTQREQIYSDEIQLLNNSDFDVRVNVEQIILNVDSGVSDTGVVKDCQMYLVAPDTGEKILLNKGRNGNVYSYKLAPGDADGSKGLFFCGDTSVGADTLWKDSDISIQIKLSFEKWEE